MHSVVRNSKFKVNYDHREQPELGQNGAEEATLVARPQLSPTWLHASAELTETLLLLLSRFRMLGVAVFRLRIFREAFRASAVLASTSSVSTW